MNVTASGATKAMVSHTATAREWGMGFHGDVAPWLGHMEVEGVSDYGAEIPPMETVSSVSVGFLPCRLGPY